MINRFKWLEVNPLTRKNVAVFLGIKPTGHVEVSDNKVVCDGFTDQDLCAITPELLRSSLGEGTLNGINTDDVYALFYELVRRLELPVNELSSNELTNTDEDKPIIKRGRPKKIK